MATSQVYNPHRLTVQESLNQHLGKVIRVTPTLTEDSAYADGDVLFTATEIPNAVPKKGGTSRLLNAFLVDQDLDTFGFDAIFAEKNTAIGTIHATADISDANVEAMNVLGAISFRNNTANTADLDNVGIYQALQLGLGAAYTPSILLQAESGSTSVYVSGVITTGTPTFADVDDLDLILHIEYR